MSPRLGLYIGFPDGFAPTGVVKADANAAKLADKTAAAAAVNFIVTTGMGN